MTRLGPGWEYMALGLFPPAQAASHFRESRDCRGTLSRWIVTALDQRHFPYGRAVAKVVHITLGLAQCAVPAYAYFKMRRINLLRDACVWTAFYLLFDYGAAAINACRIAHAYMCANIPMPEGLERGSADSNGDCFYDSFLQLIEQRLEHTLTNNVKTLRGQVADALIAWFDNQEDQNRPTLIQALAEKYRVEIGGVSRAHVDRLANEIRLPGPEGGKWADNIEIAALLRLPEYSQYKLQIYQAQFRAMGWSDFFSNSEAPVGWGVTDHTFPDGEDMLPQGPLIPLWNWGNVHYEPLRPTQD